MAHPPKIVYTAAGGVVMSADHSEVLLLIRPERDEVRLPKGHLDPGEAPQEAALREVQEESGYADLELVAALGQQLVAFALGAATVQRTEYYYLLRARSRQQIERPPDDDAQFFSIWVSWEEALEHLTFEAERDWIHKALRACEGLTPSTQVRIIHTRLAQVYGEPALEPHGDPLGELVNTILSQNTNDRNRDLAFAQLRARFPTWEAARDAPPEALIDAIRPAGLAPSKGPRIQAALRTITAEQGALTLDFLRELPLEQARAWLLNLNGVGPKTAAIVLLFALGRPAFPVDTHVHRVSRRLGLIPPDTSREKAHTLLEAQVPETLYYPFHLNLIRHGREICRARTPRCAECPLQDLCLYAQEGEK